MTVTAGREVELRCPVGPRRLLAVVVQRGERPTYTGDNLIEFACADCARLARKNGGVYGALQLRGADVGRVYHRYNIAGELVEVEYERFMEH